MNKIISDYGDGSFGLTSVGYVLAVAVLILAIAAAAVVIGKRQNAGKMTPKVLAFAGVSLALGFVTSYIKIEYLFGGSITLFSMFFICYIGYVYGVGVGFLAAFAFSLLQFVQTGGSYFLTPFQVCCDYFFAFTALGIAGFWYKKKNGLVIGYIVACLVRGLFHTIGGYMYWMDYMPESFPKSLTMLYSPIYNYSYILTEMAATLIIINIPPVKKALERVTSQARGQ